MNETLVNVVGNATGVDMAGSGGNGHWNSSPAWKLPGWAEPVMVVMILFLSCFFTRRHSVSLFGSPQKELYQPLRSNSPGVFSEPDSEGSTPSGSRIPSPLPLPSTAQHANYYPPTRRTLFCGLFSVRTPNITRFRDTWLSRVLNKFPFLTEMLYWVITYGLYQTSRILSQKYFADGIWERAQAHGETVLWLEHSSSSPLFYFFPITELSVQQWFMSGTWGLTFLNRAYALIHIPGTVGFIGWYYYAARNHERFAVVRRTLTLSNWIAFGIFSVWPCMPPRLLPERWGFIDTVRRDSSESVWMAGKYVNSLAAMPSMHFAYSFIVGIAIVQWSGVLQNWKWTGSRGSIGAEKKKRLGDVPDHNTSGDEDDDDMECALGLMGDSDEETDLDEDEFLRDQDRSSRKRLQMWIVALGGIAYPCLILTAIVATANHYWLDAVAGAIVAGIAYLSNRIFLVFLPIEDWFLWCCRAEKPVSTTGQRWRTKAGF